MTYTGLTSAQDIAKQLIIDSSLKSEIKRFLNYKHYSDDVLQDIILQILTLKESKQNKLIQICRNDKFKIWLFSILNNQKTNPKSKTNKNYKISTSIITPECQISINDSIILEDKQHKQMLIEIIKKEVSLLKPQHKMIFFEYVLKSKSYRDLAKKINKSKSTIANIIDRIKIKLKSKLNDHI